MPKNRAARSSGNCPTPRKSASTDKRILSDYERVTLVGGIILGVSFGVMLACGIAL